jgi:organic radical activating enzyme
LWLKEFTDIKYIYILGGEPLTHPDFQKICNLLISQNIDTHVVTSGKISKLKYEENNLKYMLRMYSEGLVSIDLSYHDERNEMVYKKILQAIKARYLKY